MLRRFVIVCGVLLLFMTACGSDKDSSAPVDKDETAAPTAVATAKPTKEAKANGGLEDVFQPLSVMGGSLLGGGESDIQSSGQEIDPDLKAVLLTEEDIPSSFGSFESQTYTQSIDAGGVPLDIAMSGFYKGDPAAGTLSTMILSGVMAWPAGSLEGLAEELDGLEKEFLDPEKIQEELNQPNEEGVTFREFELAKVEGLGELGYHIYVVLDFSGQSAEELAERGLEAYQAGMTCDVYGFIRGDRILGVMIMWPAGEQPNVDGLALAEIMDGRAQ